MRKKYFLLTVLMIVSAIVVAGVHGVTMLNESHGDGESEGNDLTSIYLQNADFASLDGWIAVCSDQYFDYGNGLIGTYQVKSDFSPATVDDIHLAAEYCLGVECRWSSSFASLTQQVELPAGNYMLTYDVENVNGKTRSANYDNLFKVIAGDIIYNDESTEWMKGQSGWTTHTIKFTLTDATPITISLGYGTGDNNMAADYTPALYVSHLTLGTFDPQVESKSDWQNALQAAQEALNKEEYASITGYERTVLVEEVAKDEPTTDEGYQEAAAALQVATSNFVSAQAAYNELAAVMEEIIMVNYSDRLPYASEEKKAAAQATLNIEVNSAAEATEKVSTIYTAYRQLAESNALLENVEGAMNLTDYIQNPNALDGLQGWSVVKGGNGNGSINVQRNEPLTDGEGNSGYAYFDGGDWGSSAWNVSLQQTITLPAGKYLLSVSGRAAPAVALSLFANEESCGIPSLGNTGGLFGRGWNDSSLEFELKEAGNVTIGVRGETEEIHNWMSFTRFRLMSFSAVELDPIIEEPVADPLFADGTYYIYNEGMGKYLAAGGSWGTQAIVNDEGLDYILTYNNGKYTIDSQVSNGGEKHYFNGAWNDDALFEWTFTEVADNIYTLSNGKQFLSVHDNEVGFADVADTLASHWKLIPASERYASEVAKFQTASIDNPVDASFLIKGANFNRNDMRNAAWVVNQASGNVVTIAGPSGNAVNYGCEFWNNTYNFSQTIENLPDGVYEFSIAGFGTNGTTYIFANEVEAPFANVESSDKFATVLANIADGAYIGNTTGKVYVTGGVLTIGVKRTEQISADWTVLDNARLTYYGNNGEVVNPDPGPNDPIVDPNDDNKEEGDVTSIYLRNAGFDEDLTWNADGSKKGEIVGTQELSNRSIAAWTADSTAYATVNPSTPKSRPDGRTLEATNGFKGRIKGWTLETNGDFPGCEWTYFGSLPYALADQAIPVSDDGSTYITVPSKPELANTENNIGFVYMRAGWGGLATYSQKVTLPSAQYRLEYWSININPNGINGSNLSQVICGDNVYFDNQGFTSTEWSKHTIDFISTGECTIQLGFESSGGSGSNPFLCIDDVHLFKTGELEEEPNNPNTEVIAQRFASIGELDGQSFAIVNETEGKALYGSSAQNLGYDVFDAAFVDTNSGYLWKIVPSDVEDGYLLRLQTPAGEPYSIWGSPGYLNSQPADGWSSFILGLNNQWGQDGENLALWNLEYAEGWGFALKNVGTGFYLTSTGPANSETPVYFTFCTINNNAIVNPEPEPILEPAPIPEGSISLQDVSFNSWNGWGVDAIAIAPASCNWVLCEPTSVAYGDPNVRNFVDLSAYEFLKVKVVEGLPRFLMNRDVYEGLWNEDEMESHLIDNTMGGWSSKYFTSEIVVDENTQIEYTIYTVNLKQMVIDKGFAHLHAIKGANFANVTIVGMFLSGNTNDVARIPSIINGSFDNWSDGWMLENASSSNCDYGTMEFYNTNFDLYQTFTNVKSGLYLLEAQAFYRTGNYNVAWNERDTATVYPCLYANDNQIPVKNMMSESLPYNRSVYHTGSCEWINLNNMQACYGDENAEYVPNTMYSGSYAFGEGFYKNRIFTFVDNKSLRIGIRSVDATAWGRWTMMDNFKLTYISEGQLRTLVNELIAAANGNMSASLREAVEEIAAKKDTASYQTLGALYAALPLETLNANIDAYAALNNAIAAVEAGLENENAAQNIVAEVKEVLTEIKANYRAGLFSTEEAKAQASLLNEYIVRLSYNYLTINVATPGTLGDLILAKVNNFSDVQGLKLSGKLNSDDLYKLRHLLTSVRELDLSDLNMTTIPESQFYEHQSLVSVVLPNNLQTIESNAFYNCQALANVSFPTSLQYIGSNAFYNARNIESAVLPESLATLGSCAFQYSGLKSITFPSTLKVISDYCFYGCDHLTEVHFNGQTEINAYAFENCGALQELKFPETLTRIGYQAFRDCYSLRKIEFNEGLTTIGNYAFFNCYALTSITLPSTLKMIEGYYAFRECNDLNQVTCKSIVPPYTNSVNILGRNGVKLYVPLLSVSVYKQTAGWAEFDIEGIDIMPDYIEITNKYMLNWPDELIGNTEYKPAVRVGQENRNGYKYGSLYVFGNSTLSASDFTIVYDWNQDYSMQSWNSRADQKSVAFATLMNDANVRADKVTIEMWTPTNIWNFFSLPFDVKMSDIRKNFPETPFVIRKYDSAARAAGNGGQTWVNVADDETLNAGQGYIIQSAYVNNRGYAGYYFPAIDNGNKNRIFANGDVEVELSEYPAEFTHNLNWNFVGNPYPAYFDARAIQFDAPITVWNPYNNNYEAYSPVDDQLILKPGEAFFVQRPGDMESGKMVFKKEGRQTDLEVRDISEVVVEDNEVVAPSGARAGKKTERSVFNLYISDGEQRLDHTRFVINSQASEAYESCRDASKFMSMSSDAIQLYTIEDNMNLAINERPLGNGFILLGMTIGKAGSYTLSLDTNVENEIYLVDLTTGKETLLNGTEGFTFNAVQGTLQNHYAIRIGNGSITGISEKVADGNSEGTVYNLNGMRVNKTQKGMFIKDGKKMIVR